MNKCLTYIAVTFAVLCSAYSCGQRAGGEKQEPVQQKIDMLRQFPMVTPPAMVEDQNEKIEYMAMHYWDAFMKPEPGFRCDSLHIAGVQKGEVEQKVANFIYMLDMVPMKVAGKAVARLAQLAEAYELADSSSNVFESFIILSEKYLYDPNSPMRNEDYYQAYAVRLQQSQFLDEAVKEKYAGISQMCSKNAVGTSAADFRFMDRKGKVHSLYGIGTEYTLLFFSNPGCESCLEIINNLKANAKVNEMIEMGTLSVVNVYIDEDIEAWRDYMPIYPETWYNGFDPEFRIRNENTYHVRAIPSLYLLDERKTVLIKDAFPEKLFKLIDSL